MDENNNQQTATPNVDFNNPKILDSLLQFYMNIVRNGLLAVIPYAGYLVAVLGVIDLATSWWLYDGELKFNVLIQKALKISFLFFLVINWHPIMQLILRSFGFIGYLAGSHDHNATTALSVATGGADADKFLSPSNIIDLSDTITNPLYEALGKSGSGIGSYILFAICWLMIKVGFIFIALQVLLTNIEFAVFTVLSVVLLPFGCLKYTKFLSERCYSGVFTFGIKLMVVYFLLGLIGGLSEDMKAVIDDTSEKSMLDAAPKIMKAGLAYFTIGYLTWKLPNLISSMMSGQPNLGNGMTPGSMMRNTMGAATGAYRGLSMAAKGYSAVRGMWQAAGAGAIMAAATAGLTEQSNKSESKNKPAQDQKGASAPGGAGDEGGNTASMQAAQPTSSGSVALPGINNSEGGKASSESSSSEEASTGSSPATQSAGSQSSGQSASGESGNHYKGVVGTVTSNAKSFAKGAAMVGADAAVGLGKAALAGAVSQGFVSSATAQSINQDVGAIAGVAKSYVGARARDVKESWQGLKSGAKAVKSASSDFAKSSKAKACAAIDGAARNYMTDRSYQQLSHLASFSKGVAAHTGRFAKLAVDAAIINSHLMQSYMEGGRVTTLTMDSLKRMDYMRENHNYLDKQGIARRDPMGAQVGEDSHSDV